MSLVLRWPPADLPRLRAVMSAGAHPISLPHDSAASLSLNSLYSTGCYQQSICSNAAFCPQNATSTVTTRAIRLDRSRSIRVATEERRMRDGAPGSRRILLLNVISVYPPSSFPSNHPEGLYILHALCLHLPPILRNENFRLVQITCALLPAALLRTKTQSTSQSIAILIRGWNVGLQYN